MTTSDVAVAPVSVIPGVTAVGAPVLDTAALDRITSNLLGPIPAAAAPESAGTAALTADRTASPIAATSGLPGPTAGVSSSASPFPGAPIPGSPYFDAAVHQSQIPAPASFAAAAAQNAIPDAAVAGVPSAVAIPESPYFDAGIQPPHRSRKRSSTAWCITIRTSTRTCIARLMSSPRDRPTHTKARARRCSVSLVRDLQKKSFSSAAPQKQSTSLPRATAGSSSARAMRSFCRRSSTIPTSCRGNSWRSGSPPSSAWFR